MSRKHFHPLKILILFVILFSILSRDAYAADTGGVLAGGIAINEVLADPNSSTNNFDTDGNGTADTLDEFVEIYNLSGASIDIGNYELWDAGTGLWFTFPGGTMLGPGNYAFVIAGVQSGGSLPTLPPGNLAFDAGRTGGAINNGGDNVVLYDPNADEFVQILYNGDAADNPPADYSGFSATATLVGAVEDWGSDTDGVSLVRDPSGDENVVQHNTISAVNASPGDATPLGDLAPSVASTNPGNGDTNVAVDANIDINFSEDVTVTGSWFDITCDASGAHTATVTGGPQNYTLDPDTDFDNGENCTVTVFAAQVTDNDTDDPPDNMDTDASFSFDTTSGASVASDLLITGLIDGPLSGGTPKAVEFYVLNDIADLSIYGFGSANNGGGSDGEEFTFPPNPATAGDFIYVATESPNFTAWFGFAPDYTDGSAPNINGDDAVELFQNGTVVDVFGDINVDGTGQPWEHLDGWAYRVDETGPDGSAFVLANWTFSGPNALDGETDNASAATPFPTGSYVPGDTGGGLGNCGDPATLIHVIQGSGLSSLEVGNTHIIEGVVVGDFQNNGSSDNGDLNGFYVQEEDADADGDPATSEGIFVFGADTDVAVGDHVRVSGTVSEFSTSGGASLTTELGNTEEVVCTTPAPMPAATAVTLPVSDITDFERYEGMLVTFPQSLVISEYFNFDRFNEIVLTTERQYQPTAVVEPGAAANAVAAANALARITLDDGRPGQNPDPAIHPNGNDFDLTNLFRGGDLVQNATGVMDDAFGLYRIQPVQGANFTPVNPRTAPDDVGGSLKVASFNVLNYFTTIDTGAPICGPAQDQGCRGADNQEELDRQRAKIIAALVEINADVVGIIEVENTNSDAVADLVAGLNDVMGAGTYAYIDTGTIGTDAIRVAMIYKPGSVTPVGSHAILDSSVDSRFLDTKNRPVLAQSFSENSNGAVFTVAVNHLKSKGSDCNDVGDPDLGDGAGNCNITRLMAAQALVDWLASDPTGSGDPDFLIMGDLNSYDKEDPIDAILAGADDLLGSSDDYVDLGAFFGGELAYSYVFNGQLGYLDYALANNSLASQVTGTTEWHINADEPDILDYDTSFKQPAQDALYEPNAYRASDHDPVIVGLHLNAPPVCGAAYPSRDRLWPQFGQFVDIHVLGVTDPDGDPIMITIDSIFQDEPVFGPGSGFTAPDGMGIGTDTALVRSERMRSGNGRFYHIFFTASDGNGNSCSGEVLVSVPRGRGRNARAIDDGALYDSTLIP